jgi:hypothetical protein
MKFFLLYISLAVLLLHAKQTQQKDDWELKQFNIYFENDLFAKTDDQYSSGEKFSLLYYIPNNDNALYNLLIFDDGAYDSYVNFSLVNQIFTPKDITTPDLIEDDRPYAGWTFVEMGIHKSSKDTLQSLYLQLGTIGPHSQAEEIQEFIHSLTGSQAPQGWDNQLKNEFGLNLRYIYKWRFEKTFMESFQTAIIPNVELDLGNISIQATTGVLARIGWNIPKDFGPSTINSGGETGITTYSEHQSTLKNPWSFSLNFNASAGAVARDIFLDGNTFKDSHSVEKEHFIFSTGIGFTARYKRVALDYYYQKHTKHFELEKVNHGYGSMILSFLF